ncbi:MAG: hydrogenase [Elusimicrobia bacterium]|nr:hydrogenase [Elusimicrobiota bacterium]
MTPLLVCAAVLVLSGALAAVSGRHARLVGALGAVAGALAGIPPAFLALAGRGPEPLTLAWGLPIGAFSVGLDPLSAFFLVPILALTAAAAVYGTGYLGLRGRGSWFFYNMLTASMVLVTAARDGVLFLFAWEAMSLASYFLVTFEDDQESARQAGLTYLIASHLGTAFLLIMFALLDMGWNPPRTHAAAVFLLALAGFGAKAGFIPLHVWLPDAHPAAPSHVSAVMSGVMIKTGIYGLLRVLTLLGAPPAWWGWLLIAVGSTSGVLGVLLALAQHDLKRLLAYHSVENIGIIALGIGTGLVGTASNSPTVALLGFGGALLHVLNHALFKGLLFLAAGSVLHAAGTRDMERLGGLMKRMPWTGAAFLTGAAAICGLPPLNGFVSEFLIFLGGLTAVTQGRAVCGGVVVGSLALIGGLALACFTKAFGVVFLGGPRSERPANAEEAGPAMLLSMAVLAGACLLIGLSGPFVLRWSLGAVAQASGIPARSLESVLQDALAPLMAVSACGAGLLAAIVALAALRAWLLSGREVRQALTWDCGYAAPTSRMQYTASSFAQPIVSLFAPWLRTRERADGPDGYFPSGARFSTETPDLCREGIYEPAFHWLLKGALRMRVLQHGRVQAYVLYIALTLLVLLGWRLK